MIIIIQVAALATLALLLSATSGSDMSLQYTFANYICRHAPIRWIVRVVYRSWEQHSVCGDDPSIQQSMQSLQQSTRYYIILLSCTGQGSTCALGILTFSNANNNIKVISLSRIIGHVHRIVTVLVIEMKA